MKKKIIAIISIIVVIAIIVMFINKKTNSTQIEYKISNVEEYKYVKYRENDKYGIIDRNGNIIIQAKYANIEIPNPEKDVFICHEGDNNIVINSKSERLFEKYNKVEAIKLKNVASTLCFEKSVLKYEKDELYGIISLEGEELTKNIYSSIENLQSTEGKLLVSKDQKYGVININGKTLVENKYDGVTTDYYFSEENQYVDAGFIVSNTTSEGYRYGYVNYQGKSILDVQYNDIIRIPGKKEIYLIAAQNGQYGLFKDEKQLIKPEYQSISYTDNGGIIIEKNEQLGIANLKGEIKVQAKYAQIEEDGIYFYAQNSSENDVYNIEGNKVNINFNKSIYKTENDNYNITTILNNDVMYYGIESNEGKELVSENYKYIEYIYGNYFIAENEDEKYGVIDSNGKIMIKFNYDLIQRIKNKNVIQATSKDSKKIKLFSIKLDEVASIKSATVKNNENHIYVYNDKENVYLDKDGNKVSETSEIVKKDILKELPNKIEKYKKVQYSLDDVYYE